MASLQCCLVLPLHHSQIMIKTMAEPQLVESPLDKKPTDPSLPKDSVMALRANQHYHHDAHFCSIMIYNITVLK